MCMTDRSMCTSAPALRLIAFNSARWIPTREEWILANRLIQRSEAERISRFAFKKDAKASMMGRLLLRKLLADFRISNSCDDLERNSDERPILKRPTRGFDFNVSHQGNFSVAVAGFCGKLGVDIMQMQYTGGRTIPEFFRLMSRQFTEDEWVYIRRPSDEKDQVANFYRMWTLKESYVKAIGVGLAMDLQRINFSVCEQLRLGEQLRSTTVKVDGTARPEWTFHEILVDDEHCLAVAVFGQDDKSVGRCEQIDSFGQVVSNLQPRTETCSDVDDRLVDELWSQFKERAEKPCL
ncbi:L-aminoadipate-semialdehyde dehydrogenase-phosphopantetheinyl transferase [Galendromus occidentalis]|uniref:L-aminoadipate-semialdehyde dehydrogenase-phosphopantetheinyl transferase n=1 Tax=Galendromus occidentalis TaxID=34638 RepID=A0AAJ6QQG4_9ACAR|nr:L-aminoadipate-semialdehyde dehydrogenase-phosphopantetheinyl transferase [Galendromus occidentalis]